MLISTNLLEKRVHFRKVYNRLDWRNAESTTSSVCTVGARLNTLQILQLSRLPDTGPPDSTGMPCRVVWLGTGAKRAAKHQDSEFHHDVTRSFIPAEPEPN